MFNFQLRIKYILKSGSKQYNFAIKITADMLNSQSSLRYLKLGLTSILAVILFGTVGYTVVEGWNLFDSFYMTIITISTTGFRELRPLTLPGRILTIFLIITGVLAIAYTGGRAVQLILETHFFRRRKMNKRIDELNGHYIICGFGRMGKVICEDLAHNKIPFVVIENNPKKIEELIQLGYLFIEGDATHDNMLLKAGVKRAKGLVAVISTDAQNVFTVLSAKGINPEIFVVARAIEEETESKLRRAGADRVVKPIELGGSRMVHLLLKPGVIDFIDGVARSREVEISLEEVSIPHNSKLVNKKLKDSPLRKDWNIIIVAIIKHDGRLIYNPNADMIIEENDKLIAIGPTDSLAKLTESCKA